MNLYLYHNLFNDPVLKAVLSNDISLAQQLLFDFAENEAVSSTIFREYLIRQILEDENTFSNACSNQKCGGTLSDFARRDIGNIFETLNVTVFPDYERNQQNTPPFYDYEQSLKNLLETTDIEAFFKLLTLHYTRFGCGKLSKFTAFRYRGALTGIKEFTAPSLDDLVGLEYQKQTLIANTKAFVDGKNANNVILFGDSGCGKSSSVKALLTMFQNSGLRLIEYSKEYISQLPELFTALRSRPYRYIIFLDDLSFENNDANYKNLKIAMEGQLEQQSSNVLIYATSNRRHLLTEYWADRMGDEVHINDTKQEKLSLSERFGIRIVFASPSQDEYLKIVAELLKKENIELTPEIQKQAILWEMSYNGRSGRTAKQFVTHLTAQMGGG